MEILDKSKESFQHLFMKHGKNHKETKIEMVVNKSMTIFCVKINFELKNEVKKEALKVIDIIATTLNDTFKVTEIRISTNSTKFSNSKNMRYPGKKYTTTIKMRWVEAH